MTDQVIERKFAQGAVLTEDDRAFLRGVIAQFDAFADWQRGRRGQPGAAGRGTNAGRPDASQAR